MHIRDLYKDRTLLKWLLSHGPSIREQPRPSIELAARHASLETIRFLIDQGASFEQTDAIVLAALGHIKGIPECLKVILLLSEHGVSVNAYHLQFHDEKEYMSMIGIRNRMKALHYASRGGKADLVGVLLAKGADQSPKTFDGKSPDDLALESGHTEIIRLLASNKVSEFLLRMLFMIIAVAGEHGFASW